MEPDLAIFAHGSSTGRRRRRTPRRVPLENRTTPSNLKAWLRGTHHGVGADHLDAYLDEFVFRFNRRYHPMAGFATLLGRCRPSPDDG